MYNQYVSNKICHSEGGNNFCPCRYWHRSLNPKKLVEVKFSHLSRNMTMQRQMKLLKLPDATKTEGLREMTGQDVDAACALLNDVSP